MMITETPDGPYPYAGVPWFSTPFGRDGIITALEVLWLEPEIARGVLGYLAANQATETLARARRAAGQDPARGARRRDGGARRGAVRALLRQRRRHAAVRDAGGAYLRRTGDRASCETLWRRTSSMRSLDRRDGDADGDGFVEYARQTDKGLVQQGWKDSPDSVFHADGTLAEGPIALCEVQGYVYGAFRGAAELPRALGQRGARRGLPAQAQVLRAAFARRSGPRSSAPTCWRSTGASGRAGAQLERRPRALHRHRRAASTRAARPRR